MLQECRCENLLQGDVIRLGNLLCVSIKIVRNVDAENQVELSNNVETSICVLNGNTFP